MSAEPADAVTFSDLSRNPRAVAERARRLGRLRVTHRDAPDFFLTAAEREEERDENLVTASRMFAALARSESGTRAVESALAAVFPSARHRSAAQGRRTPPAAWRPGGRPRGRGRTPPASTGSAATWQHTGTTAVTWSSWEYEVTSGGRSATSSITTNTPSG